MADGRTRVITGRTGIDTEATTERGRAALLCDEPLQPRLVQLFSIAMDE
jgi:hypothetical protein